MRLTVADREAFRERVKKLIPQMKKSDIVKHFTKEGIARRTVYNAIDRLATNQPTKDKKRSGRPNIWTAANKTKLKRLSDHRTGVSQTRLGQKFGVHRSTIGRQLAKMKISYRKRQITPKYSANQQQRAEELSGKLANNLY